MLERLSRHGPASGGAGGDGGGIAGVGRRRRRHPQHLRQQPFPRAAGARACRSAWARSGADLHLGLCRQRGGAVDPGARDARHGGIVRCAEPCLDDRRASATAAPKSTSSATTIPATWPICSPISMPGGPSSSASSRSIRWMAISRRSASIVRRRRAIWRDDLSRRGPCGRALRSARRRHRRARRADAPPDRDPGHARQGVRRDGRLYRRLGGARRFHPQPRAGLHLHHLAAAGDRRRRARQHPPPEAKPSRTRAPSGARRPP